MTSSTSSSDAGAARAGPRGARHVAAAWLGPLLTVLLALPLVIDETPPFGNPAARRMDAALDSAPPEQLIVSNSLGGWGIDQEFLSELLGRGQDDGRRPSVAKCWEGGAGPVSFLAMLQRRVFERGHRPERVFIVTRLDTLLSAGLLSQRDVEAYVKHSPRPIAEVEAKLANGGNALLTRATRNRVALRDGLLDVPRDLGVGLVFGQRRDRGLLRAGREAVGPALDVVLAAPVSLPDEAASLPTVRMRLDPLPETIDETLVPELIALCEAHAAHCTFVLVPVSERERAHAEVAPELEQAFMARAAATSADVIDLRDLKLPRGVFWDTQHLDRWGRALLTAELARQLAGLPSLEPLVGSPLRFHGPDHPQDLLAGDAEPRFRRATPLPRRELRDLRASEEHTSAFAAPLGAFASLSDDQLTLRSRRPHGTPLIIREDERALPPLQQITRATLPAWAPALDEVLVYPSVAGWPAPIEHTYTVELAASRRCEPLGRWWLYPGDSARVDVEPARVPIGARRLRVRADAFDVGGAAHAALRVRLTAGDELLVDAQLPCQDLAGAGVAVRLDAPLSDDDRACTLELTLDDDGPVLLLGRALALP